MQKIATCLAAGVVIALPLWLIGGLALYADSLRAETYSLQIVSRGGHAYDLDRGMSRGACLRAMAASPDSECVREGL